jgi:hypothetical protein
VLLHLASGILINLPYGLSKPLPVPHELIPIDLTTPNTVSRTIFAGMGISKRLGFTSLCGFHPITWVRRYINGTGPDNRSAQVVEPGDTVFVYVDRLTGFENTAWPSMPCVSKFRMLDRPLPNKIFIAVPYLVVIARIDSKCLRTPPIRKLRALIIPPRKAGSAPI